MIAKPKVKEEIELDDSELLDSRDIPVDVKDDEPQTQRVDFQEEDLASQFASQQTKPSKDEGGIDPNTPADTLQKDILDYENSKSGKMEYKDFLKFSEFLITLIDTAISTGLRWFAKDTSSSAYSMPSANRKLLVEQLALILAKYQAKFSIEFMFFMGLIIMYAPAFIAAAKNRKDNSKPRKILKEASKLSESVTTETLTPEVKEEKIFSEGEIKVGMKKRKQGKQPKVY